MVPVALAMVVGILVAPSAGWSSAWWLLSAGLACSAVAACARPRLGAVLLLAAWMVAGMARMALWRERLPSDVRGMAGAEPSTVAIRGRIIDDPVEWSTPGEPERQALVIAVTHVRAPSAGRVSALAWRAVSGMVRVRLQGRVLPLHYGDEVLMEGQWSRAVGPGNPGQFDWRAALERQRIEVVMVTAPHQAVVRLGRARASAWLLAVFR